MITKSQTVPNPSLTPNRLPTQSLDLERECPLLNPRLPPVTDSEHNIHSCFCYMCTCGDHQCPGNYRLKHLNPSNHFRTNYKLYFKKPGISKTSIIKRPDQYNKTTMSSENKTISQSSYIPHFIEAKSKDVREPMQVSPFKFSGNSIYSSEYPNWGMLETEKLILQRNKFKPCDIRASTKSQYQEAYLSSVNKDTLQSKELAKSFKLRNWKSDGLLSPSSDFIGEVRHVKDYPLLPTIAKPKIEKRSESSTKNNDNWKGQFVSTYTDSYHGSMPDRFIRQKKLRII